MKQAAALPMLTTLSKLLQSVRLDHNVCRLHGVFISPVLHLLLDHHDVNETLLVYIKSDLDACKLYWCGAVMTIHGYMDPNWLDSNCVDGKSMQCAGCYSAESYLSWRVTNLQIPLISLQQSIQWRMDVLAHEAFRAFQCHTTAWNSNTLKTNIFSLLSASWGIRRISRYLCATSQLLTNSDCSPLDY